jgi:FAD:protein FMN transferase
MTTARSTAEPRPAAPRPGRLRHAEPVMGTVVSLDIPAAAAAVLPRVLRWLHWVDATFSPYRDDSDVSRFRRGELTLAQCAPELAEVLGECAIIREVSDGYFTTTPGGRFDPSGLVKGWAIERAATMLSAAGFAGHCVNGGGDLQCSGEPQAGQPWRVGIADPLRPGEIAVVLAGRDFAVATSGTAERGAHIVNPHTGRPASGLASVTVVGPRLAAADAYATAAFAMGDAARAWAESLAGHEAFGVTADGGTWQTSRLGSWLG